MYIDSTSVPAHRHSAGAAPAQREQAIGVSRGGRGAKVHALCDGLGYPVAVGLTGARQSDVTRTRTMLEDQQAQRVVADRGYDYDRLRAQISAQGAEPIILSTILLPAPVEFRSASFHDVVSFLRAEGYRLDTEEEDAACRGVSVWIGVHPSSPLILGEPGESRALANWLGKLRISVLFPAGTCLGSVWQTLAKVFGLETRLHEEEEEGGKLILWLPSAFPDAPRFNEESTLSLAFAVAMAKEVLRVRGW